MYILNFNSKSFIAINSNGDIMVVPNMSRATMFDNVADAVEALNTLNEDYEEEIVKIMYVSNYLGFQ